MLILRLTEDTGKSTTRELVSSEDAANRQTRYPVKTQVNTWLDMLGEKRHALVLLAWCLGLLGDTHNLIRPDYLSDDKVPLCIRAQTLEESIRTGRLE